MVTTLAIACVYVQILAILHFAFLLCCIWKSVPYPCRKGCDNWPILLVLGLAKGELPASKLHRKLTLCRRAWRCLESTMEILSKERKQIKQMYQRSLVIKSNTKDPCSPHDSRPGHKPTYPTNSLQSQHQPRLNQLSIIHNPNLSNESSVQIRP